MAGTVDLFLRWTLAAVYAELGALFGAAIAFVAIKILLLVLGTTVLSVKAVQAIVIAVAVGSALLGAVGFIRR